MNDETFLKNVYSNLYSLILIKIECLVVAHILNSIKIISITTGAAMDF